MPLPEALTQDGDEAAAEGCTEAIPVQRRSRVNPRSILILAKGLFRRTYPVLGMAASNALDQSSEVCS